MQTEQRRQICILYSLLFGRANAYDIEYQAFLRRRCKAIQKSIWLAHLIGKTIDFFTLIWLSGVACENENFETRVCRKEVLQFEYSSIRSTDEDLREDSLSDD
jgi:hypothetical protein